MELLDSGQTLLKRLRPKVTDKPASRLVTVPHPVEGWRLGGPPLRDVELLNLCTHLLTDLMGPTRSPESGVAGAKP